MPTYSPKVLIELGTELLTKAGASPEHAATIAEVSIWAAVRGIDSHGVARIAKYAEMFGNGIANPSPSIEVSSGASAVALVAADRAPGPVALTQAADHAVETARTTGIAAVAVKDTVHTGAIGYYTSRIAGSGLVGIAFVAGMPNMGYTGAKGAAVATSPLAIAVPGVGGTGVLLDMATATIALGKIAQHKAAGKVLPEGAATTADGEPTTDPELATMPTPMAGPKGSGMSLAFELITSVLAGAPILASVHTGGPRKHRQNALLIAIDPAAFGGDGFTADVDATIAALKALPVAEGYDEISVPGDGSNAVAEERTAHGIPVKPKAWKELEGLAAELGIDLPEATA